MLVTKKINHMLVLQNTSRFLKIKRRIGGGGRDATALDPPLNCMFNLNLHVLKTLMSTFTMKNLNHIFKKLHNNFQ